MDARLIARANALGRALIGVVAIADPQRMLEPWIGSDAKRPAGFLRRSGSSGCRGCPTRWFSAFRRSGQRRWRRPAGSPASRPLPWQSLPPTSIVQVILDSDTLPVWRHETSERALYAGRPGLACSCQTR